MESKPKTQIPRLGQSDHEKAVRRRKRANAVRLAEINGYKSGEVARFYNSPIWKNTRQSKLMMNPVCELSLLEGHVEEADNVHHLIKFQAQPNEVLRWRLFSDPDNLISLTSSVHQAIHYAPSRLTQKQLDYLLELKKNIVKKYESLGLIIENPPDVNVS